MTGKEPCERPRETIASLGPSFFPMKTGANTRSSALPVPLDVPVVAISESEADPTEWESRHVPV